MPPRPFPYPISSGIDACSVHRIASILRSPDLTNRWARRVFTRLEWPGLWSRFLETQRALAASGGSHWRQSVLDNQLAKIRHPSIVDESVWMLPRLSVNAPHDTVRPLEDQVSFMGLARHLAGR